MHFKAIGSILEKFQRQSQQSSGYTIHGIDPMFLQLFQCKARALFGTPIKMESLQGVKYWVDYSVHIRQDQERCLLNISAKDTP